MPVLQSWHCLQLCFRLHLTYLQAINKPPTVKTSSNRFAAALSRKLRLSITYNQGTKRNTPSPRQDRAWQSGAVHLVHHPHWPQYLS